MRKFAPFIILTVGVVLALVAGILIYGKLKGAAKVTREVVPAVPVVVAAKDLPWGTKLVPEMIKRISLPTDTLPSGYFSDPEVLRERVLLADVRKNEPILEHRLAPRDVVTGGLAAVLDPEKRAMAIKVDEVVGVAGFLYPRSRVDVFVTMRGENRGVEKPLSKLVLQNILVLSVGSEMEKNVEAEKRARATVVTLEVTPEEGEKLALAANTGKLQLALRNPLNAASVITTGATVPALLAYSIPFEQAPMTDAASRMSPASSREHKVIVINGAKATLYSY